MLASGSPVHLAVPRVGNAHANSGNGVDPKRDVIKETG